MVAETLKHTDIQQTQRKNKLTPLLMTQTHTHTHTYGGWGMLGMKLLTQSMTETPQNHNHQLKFVGTCK